ncbi:MAG: hypothetical protein WCS73_00645 [Lentisphaeria bacterium]
MTIRGAFATTDITPAIGAPIPGDFTPRISIGIREPLKARAVVLDNGKELFAIVGVDSVSITNETVAEARKLICGNIKVFSPRQILISASHTHSGGPANSVLGTEIDLDYCHTIAVKISEAVEQAWREREVGSMACVSGECPGWAFNRRWVQKDGSHRTFPVKGSPDNICPAGPTDSEIKLIAFRDGEKNIKGMIGNFTCHSTVEMKNQFSPDFCAFWQKSLQKIYGEDFILVFLNGACGDVTQIDYSNLNQDVKIEEMGAALAKASENALRDAVFSDQIILAHRYQDCKVPLRHPDAAMLERDKKLLASGIEPWTPEMWHARDRQLLEKQQGSLNELSCSVDIYHVGDFYICAAPWQPFCEYGLRLKEGQPGEILIAMMSNGNIGYVPCSDAFSFGGYEAILCRGSHLKPAAGDIILRKMLDLLDLF